MCGLVALWPREPVALCCWMGTRGLRRGSGLRGWRPRGRVGGGGVLRDSVRAEFECGLRFTDAVGGAPVLVHLFFAVVELSHIGVM